MITSEEAEDLMNGGGVVVAADGNAIGAIGVVFLDAVTGEPAWVSARGWADDGGELVIPLSAASVVGTDITVAFDRQQIHDAPRIAGHGHLAPSDERSLRDYYRLEASPDSDSGPGTARDNGLAPADGVMIRSEEQLRVGTEVVESGRVRLRKHIVTEEVTVTVQVSHEEMRLESMPGGDPDDASALSGIGLGGQVVEMILYAQRPVVTMETVAVERVRMSTHVVTEQVEVVDQVRQERLVADQSVAGDGYLP